MSAQNFESILKPESEREKILIPRPEEFVRLKEKFKEGGAVKMHVLADFDRTLTRAFVSGAESPSIIAILRDENYLTPDYPAQAKVLSDYYHPLENDYSLSLEVRKKAMSEWWQKHFELLLTSGLSRNDIEKAVQSPKLKLRNGYLDFFQTLNQRNIPLVIMSAGGLGEESIEAFLKKENCLFPNISIISNAFIWSGDKAIGVREPVIHSLNKDETAIQGFPQIFKIIQARKNVLLLGDGVGDVGMVQGFDYENLMKIGFLNKEVKKNQTVYQENFDAVIVGDGSMEFVNKIVSDCN